MKHTKLMRTFLSLLIASAMAVSMLPLSMIPASAATLIDKIEIEIPAPTPGEKIDFNTYTLKTKGLTVQKIQDSRALSWFDATDAELLHSSDKPVFKYGHRYKVTFDFTVDKGYYFNNGKSYGPIDQIQEYGYIYDVDADVYVNGEENGSCSRTDGGYENTDIREISCSSSFDIGDKEIMSVKVELDEPAAGKAPDYTPAIADGEDYKAYTPTDIGGYINGVFWYDDTAKVVMDESKTFAEGHNYSVTVALKANDFCKFNGVGAFDVPISYINITGAEASRYKGSDKGEIVLITVSYTNCRPPLVKYVWIRGLSEPLPDRAPDFDVTFGGDKGYSAGKNSLFNNGIAWYDKTDSHYLALDGSETFKKGHEYRCQILVAADSEHEFYASSDGETSYVDTKINDEAAGHGAFGGNDIRKRLIVTKDMGVCRTRVISSVSVWGIMEPVPGDKPTYTAYSDNPDEYDLFYDFSTESDSVTKNGVAWYDNTDVRYLKPDTDTFKKGHTYTCHIYLLPQTGCTFPTETDSSGVMSIPGKINGRTADYVRNNLGRLEATGGVDVNYKFAPDDTPRLYTYAITDIVVPRPGEHPAYTAATSTHTELGNDSNVTGMFGYHNGIMWYDNTNHKRMEPTDTFVEGNSYNVEVTLKTTDGCIFDVGTDGTSRLAGTINGKYVNGFADVGPESERQNYIRSLLSLGVCEKEPEPYLPTLTISKIEVSDVTEPFAEFHPFFYASVDTEGLHVDTDYSSEKYHEGVAWLDMTEYHYMTEDETFIKGHVYQIEVVVTTDPGYEFYVSNSSNSGIYSYINGDLASSFTLSDRDMKNTRYVYGDFGKCPASIYDIEYDIHVESGRAIMGGHYVNKANQNDVVTVVCNSDVSASFSHWECSVEGVEIDDIYSPETSFIMPGQDVALIAVLEGDDPLPVCGVTVNGGVALDEENNIITSAAVSETVRIVWDAPETKTFDHWRVDAGGVELKDSHSSNTTFVMDTSDVTITAVAKEDITDGAYSITVKGGRALDKDGNEITSAEFGRTVNLVWNAPQNKKFDHWEADTNSIEIDDVNTPETTFLMPKRDVVITAFETEAPTETVYSITINDGAAFDQDGDEITSAKAGDVIKIKWVPSDMDADFCYWTINAGALTLEDAANSKTTFVMPESDVVLTATTDKDAVYHTVLVIDGHAMDDSYDIIDNAYPGQKVYLEFEDIPGSHYVFDGWICSDDDVVFENDDSGYMYFIMPDHGVSIKASMHIPEDPEYSISIAGGKAYDTDGNEITAAHAGEKIKISYTGPKSMVFVQWKYDPSYLEIEDIYAPVTTFIMPKDYVVLAAEDEPYVTPDPKNHTATFLSENGKSETYTMQAEEGTEITLPNNMFTVPDGMEFDGWSAGKPGDKLVLDADTTIKALWKAKEAESELVTSASCTVKIPSSGDNPSFEAKSADEDKYTAAVEKWYLFDGSTNPDMTAEDKFAGDKSYRVRVRFTAKPGYQLSDDCKLVINGFDCEIVENGVGEVTFIVPVPISDPTTPGIYGDVDNDGQITAADALLIQRQSVGMEDFSDLLIKVADVDGDGSVTAADALAVLRYSVGLTDDNKVGKPIED